MTRGTINRISKEGVPPAAENLTAICRVENCSLSWLLDGKGAPYIVGRCGSDLECAERLDELLAETGWTLHLLHDGARLALVLTQPGQFEIKGRSVDYTILEVLAGPIGPDTLERARQSGGGLRLVHIGRQALADLAAGQTGTYALTRSGGLLNHGEPIGPDHPVFTAAKVAEEPPGYSSAGGEQELITTYRGLSEPHRRAALAAVRALKETEG